MKQIIEKYQIFIFLILIIIILVTAKAKYGVDENKMGEIKPTVTPEIVIPTVIEATPTIDVKDDYPLWRQLPYEGKGFTVDKYTAPMTLQMTITTATKTVASRAVTEWINTFKEVTRQHKIIIKKETVQPTLKITPTPTK